MGKAYWFGSVSGAETFDDFVEFFRGWERTPIPETLDKTKPAALVKSLARCEWNSIQMDPRAHNSNRDAAHPMQIWPKEPAKRLLTRKLLGMCSLVPKMSKMRSRNTKKRGGKLQAR